MGFLPQLKIAQKLPLALVGSALVVSAGVGIASYFIGLQTVQNQRDSAMQAALQTSASAVEREALNWSRPSDPVMRQAGRS